MIKNSVTLGNTIGIVVIIYMGHLGNDVVPNEFRISLWFHSFSVYQRRSQNDYYNGVNFYLVRVMKCVILVTDLTYEGMHITLIRD